MHILIVMFIPRIVFQYVPNYFQYFNLVFFLRFLNLYDMKLKIDYRYM
ncbi:hypothetical protein MtrunA17_Chr5g0397001 [Medicago truncatula]|uniref:Transmembrane protein n=1 Tax=Medicago truncatula TaxID=3880 RepID=A0A396HJU0_MEDTR|nr:hypothetical protein MtrunA17_Chr5g0397001 [Medicago truncatula]